MPDNARIRLDFGAFTLTAALFDTSVAKRFYGALPLTVELTYWGGEAYGTIGRDLGAEAPVPVIPSGGLAYTNRGDYLCIFFGQTPAWPVEHVGKIEGTDYRALLAGQPGTVTITKETL